MAKDGYDIRTLIDFIQKKSSAMSDKAVELILASWRQSTEKRCNGHIKQFIEFCHKEEIDPLYATTEAGIELFIKYLNKGVSKLFRSNLFPLSHIFSYRTPLWDPFWKGTHD